MKEKIKTCQQSKDNRKVNTFDEAAFKCHLYVPNIQDFN